MNRRILILLSVALLAAATMYAPISFYPLNNLLIRLAEHKLGAKIVCGSLQVYPWRSLVAYDVRALGKGGFALTMDKASFDYDLLSVVAGKFHMKCRLDNVTFYKGSAIMNSLSEMLYIEPLGNTTFQTVKADLFVGGRETVTNNLLLSSEKIRIAGDALTDRQNNIQCFLCLSLDEDLAKGVPDEIRSSLFKRNEETWLHVCIGIMGNYRKPLLRIMTENFKMNISS